MAVNLSPVGGVAAQFFDNSGNVLTGGKIYTYTAGTTTNQATYTSATGVTAHSNPIILDASGRVPGGEIWLTDGLSYKFLIKTSTEVLIGSYDNVIGINSNFINFLTETEIQTATAGQTVFTLTTMQYQPGTNSLSVFVDGVNQYDGVTYAYTETSSTVVTFTAGLHVGALVKFTTAQTLSSGVTDASLVTFTGFNSQVGVVEDLADDDGSDWIGFEPSGTGAVARSVESKLRDTISVKDFGAVGDGVADDTAAFLSALAASKDVFVPAGTYRLTNTIKLSLFSQKLFGATKTSTTLLIDHILGEGVLIEQSQCQVKYLTITSSNTRRSVGISGSSYPLQAGLYGLKIYRNNGFLTQTLIENISVFRQPTHGIYMGGEGAGTKFFQCESFYNRGHGYMFDDRTLEGGTSSRNGIVDIELCRALDNGGNAVNLSQTGSTCYRFNILNLETIWNAWNPSVPNYENCELYLSGENNVVQQSAFGDSFADTRSVMANGDSRLVKTTLSTGIVIRASADNLLLIANRFISTNSGVTAGGGIRFLKVMGAYFTQQQLSSGSINQPFGFNFTSAIPYLFLDIQVSSSTAVTNMVNAETAGGTLRVDNKEFYIYGEQGSSLTGDHLNLTTFGSFTIVFTIANIQNKYTNLNATSATNLVALYFAGSLNLLPPAMTFYFKNVSIYAITLKNGASAGFIRTKSGGDVIVNPGQTFVVFTDDAGNPYEV